MGSWQDTARREFDGWSRWYDRSIMQRWFFGPAHDRLLDVVDIPRDARILDIGCGTGLLARRILAAHPTAHATGLDISPGMLAQAEVNNRAFGKRFLAREGDSLRLPFADRSFDLVTCCHSFHHYPDQAAAVREMYRVLRPSGQLVLIDANREGWWGWLVFDIVVQLLEWNVHHCSAREFRQLLTDSGFVGCRQETVGFWSPSLVNIASARSAATTAAPADRSRAA